MLVMPMEFERMADETGPCFARSEAHRRWLIISASSREAAERFIERTDLVCVALIVKRDVPRQLFHLRRLVATRGIERAAIHTVDWERETFPQICMLALGYVRAPKSYLIDERRHSAIPIGDHLRTLARLPADFMEAATLVALELLRGSPVRYRVSARLPRRGAVLAIWLGDHDSAVGGSITHISGVLNGFRRCGMTAGLVCRGAPPPQLARVVDDVEVMQPLSAGARLTSDTAMVAANASVRHAAARLADRLRPGLVYQRHTAFLTAGLDVARRRGVPLILEWNHTEAWVREHAVMTPVPMGRAAARLLAIMERRAARGATLVAAVSEPAAHAAILAGAPPSAVITVPNAVDLEAIRAATHGICAPTGAPCVGFVGSFGFWHGAEILVRAAAELPDGVRVLMVGDGPEKAACRRLAQSLHVGDRIEWAGALPHDEALRRLAACHVLASPHVRLPTGEPFFGSPTKLFEYMGLGRPIVASRLGQIAELLEDGRTARLVAPGDPTALAQAIAEILASPDRGQALGEAARREAQDRHTWQHRTRDILEALQR
jgi:glycosyltransferase involved in cell wall biosynthesis